jgi:hypothetical protein
MPPADVRLSRDFSPFNFQGPRDLEAGLGWNTSWCGFIGGSNGDSLALYFRLPEGAIEPSLQTWFYHMVYLSPENGMTRQYCKLAKALVFPLNRQVAYRHGDAWNM